MSICHFDRAKRVEKSKKQKDMKKNLLILMALAGAMVLAGCQKVEEEIAEEKPEVVRKETTTWTLTVQAERNDGPQTRGLSMDGDKSTATELQSVWKAGEEVLVYLAGTCIGTLTATPGENAHMATLSGEVTTTGIVANTTTLTLLTPQADWDYTGQIGRLLLSDEGTESATQKSIERLYHYTMATDVTVTAVTEDGEGKGTITTGKASFINQQSICRFSFRYNNGGTKAPIATKSVTISGANGHLVQSQVFGGTSVEGPITVTRTEADTNPFFVALRNGDETNDEVYTFTVIDGTGVTYKGGKEVPADYKSNGTFLSMKNTTLDTRLELALSDTEVSTAL
jgi:ABC-type uncharacterized transport system auxiliary subunit